MRRAPPNPRSPCGVASMKGRISATTWLQSAVETA